MAGFWGTSSSSGGWTDLMRAYKGFVSLAKGLSDFVYDPGTSQTFTSNGLIAGNNVTIGSNGLVNMGNNNNTLLIIADTLTLNGSLQMVGSPGTTSANGYNYGTGGSFGGGIVVLARQILGTGTINVSGGAGGNSITPTANVENYSYAGSGGVFNGITGSTGTNGAGGIGATGSGGALNLSNPGFNILELYFPYWIKDFINANGSSLTTVIPYFKGGSGGYGGCNNNYNYGYYNSGGGGGGSITASGGNGGNVPNTWTNTYGAGGGGGAGAGGMYIISESPIPALNLLAQGGNGGNAATNGAGGAGGAGGFIGLITPSSSAITNVTGGTSGTSNGTGVTVGTSGGNGTVLTLPLSA